MRFHRGDDEAPTQQAPVLAMFRGFLVRYYGENWEAMVLPESGEVLFSELRAILAGWLGLVMKKREEFAEAMDNWPHFVFWARVRSLAETGASCAWTERLLPAGLSSPVGLVVLCLY